MARRKKTKDLSRRDFIKTAAGAVGAVTIGGALIGARKTAEPIRLGLINPLEGQCAQWGIPIVRAGQIWADDYNAEGGILCGDGLRHPIEYDVYTNVCYHPTEELKAAKKAILEDKKDFLFQTYTPSCRRAVAPLCTQHKVLCNAYGAGYLSTEHPYLMGGITGTPTSYLAIMAHMLDKNPDIKRVAILCNDDSAGIAARWYFTAVCEAYKDKIKLVDNKTFDRTITDYFNLLGAVLKTKPDAIVFGTAAPANQALLLETGYTLGYEGFWGAETWGLVHILKRVSPEQIEGKLYSGNGVDASEPSFSAKAHKMYQTYGKRWGFEDWIGWAGVSYSAQVTLDIGLQAAESVDSTTVMKTLYSMPEVNHPIYGKSVWTGKDVYGVNHHLLTPGAVYVTRGGKHTLSGVTDLGPWWEEHKGACLPVLKEGKQTYV